jgi:hypothetical protein
VKKSLLLLVTAFLVMLMGRGICDNISNIQLSPPAPASLDFNQHVDISFDYETDEAGGVRIFARPFTAGSLTPNYAASGSPLYPVGSGNGTGFFTITSGDVSVDELRIQMYNSDQSQLLLEFFIPVEYHFAANSVSNIQLSPLPPASLAFNQHVDISFDYVTDQAGGARIFVRPFTAGSLTPNYSASGSPLYPLGSGNGTGYFTIASGDVTVDQLRIQMYNSDQSQLLLEFFIPVEYHFAANSVSNIQLSPLPPAYFTFNQHVNISFDYETDQAGGARIFVRPFTAGSLTPNYSASGSPLYPLGSGSGTGNFTIASGDVIVDELRIQMYNADQSQLLLEFFIPVEYHFGFITDINLPGTNFTGPETYILHQNYPNPFNPVTQIRYELPHSGRVILKVFNILGKEVRTLVDRNKPAGSFEVLWDGKDNRQVASGMYIYRLETQGFVVSRKMMLLR